MARSNKKTPKKPEKKQAKEAVRKPAKKSAPKPSASRTQKIAAHFRQKFAGSSIPNKKTVLESVGGAAPQADLSDAANKERLNNSRKALNLIIKDYLGDKPALREIADKIFKQGGDALKAVADDNDSFLANNPSHSQMLEVIVNTDGSRPSFLIKNGSIDFNSSPTTDWQAKLLPDMDHIIKAIACVGRVNIATRHIGTGFLISENLMVTNRHVLQAIGRESTPGKWLISPGANIDFGYEFQGIKSLNMRKLVNLLFSGPSRIGDSGIDHKKLDLAIFELEHVDKSMVPKVILQWDSSGAWAFPGEQVSIVGYPGDPGLAGVGEYGNTLLEKLFHSTYGYKRFAPGKVMNHTDNLAPWTTSHDATTLGGNSGSPVFHAGEEFAAAGLHYGGETEDPRQNWAHILADVVSSKGETAQTLGNFLKGQHILS